MIDADHSDDAEPAVDSAATVALTEAEEAVALAESRAAQARARATRLRQQAQSGAGAADTAAPPAARASRLPSWRLRAPSRKTVGVGAALMLITASLVAGGYITQQHLSLQREHRHAAEAAAAARRGIEIMMSIDADHARDNVQTLLDNTTGEFQSQLRATSTMLIEDAQKAKVTTKATVQDVAVESMAGDSAVVLVIAKSDTTNADKSKRPPVFWRISVDLTRNDGQLKMSKVDFIQ
jgi:Mce-associated membrane protein